MSEAPRGGHDSRFGKDPQASPGQCDAEPGAGAQVSGAGGHPAAGEADGAQPDDGPEGVERDAGQEIPQASGGQRGPGGDSYAWYRRGLDLLSRGSPAAAAELLERAAAAEPGARSIREALARAQFDAGRYAEAADNFRQNVEAIPSDDYAHFGLGLALARCGDPAAAAEHLALAAAMRPELSHYTEALRGVRATLAARSRAGAAPPPSAPDGEQPR
jgi:tetratricopeptide (TPR) repeat protein